MAVKARLLQLLKERIDLAHSSSAPGDQRALRLYAEGLVDAARVAAGDDIANDLTQLVDAALAGLYERHRLVALERYRSDENERAGQRLRELLTTFGATQEEALACFNEGLTHPIALSTWKAYLAKPGSARWRRTPDEVIARAEQMLTAAASGRRVRRRVYAAQSPAPSRGALRAIKPAPASSGAGAGS